MPLDITQLKPAQIGTSEIATKNDISQALIPYADPAALINTNTTTIDGGKITTGSITASQIAATSVTADKLAPTTGNTTIWSGGGLISANFNGNSVGNIGTPTQGFRLSSNAVGTSSDPTIYGAYIKGGTLEGTTLSARDIVVVTDAGYATKSVVHSSSSIVSTTSVSFELYGDGYTSATTQRVAGAESIFNVVGVPLGVMTAENANWGNFITVVYAKGWSLFVDIGGSSYSSVVMTVNGISGTISTPTKQSSSPGDFVTGPNVTINGFTFCCARAYSTAGDYAGGIFIKNINSGVNLGSSKLTFSCNVGNMAKYSTSISVFNI